MPDARPLRFTGLWISCGMLFVLLVAFLSLMPDPPAAGRLLGVKAGHFLAYAWLMLWFAQVFGSVSARLSIAVALGLLGVSLEYAQAMTDYRTFAYADMRDDALGIAAGWLAGLTPLQGCLAGLERAVGRA